MISPSLRWRLPLSYVILAFMTVLVLGAVQLTTLNGYYQSQERIHLIRNGNVIAELVSQLLAEGRSEDLIAAQMATLSFLAQVRVRIYDLDGTILADSGIPGHLQLTMALEPPAPVDEIVGMTSHLFPAELKFPPTPSLSSLFSARTDPFQFRSTGASVTGQRQDNRIELPVANTLFGFGLDGTFSLASRRSDLAVEIPFSDANGRVAGAVELSEGPAYGQEIVADVAWRWVGSGAVAVALAMLLGWVMSRWLTAPLLSLAAVTARMAAGDLSARAWVHRRDEVGALSHSFNEMANRIEEVVTALRRFVADAAHQIHTPLTALRTHVELATTSATSDHLMKAQTQIQRLELLAQNLLDLSQIEADGAPSLVQPVDLAQVVLELCEFYASRAEQAGIEFRLLPAEAPLPVAVRGAHLRLAIENMLDNALKYTPESGQVTVGMERQDMDAILWIEDTGAGISQADLPFIFNRFHRGRNATAIPGNGLGLSLVQGVVDRYGGRIAVRSEAGQTRFTLIFPVLIDHSRARS